MPQAQAVTLLPAPLPMRKRLAIALAAGFLYYLGFSPLSWWPLTFVGGAALIWLLDSSESAFEAIALAFAMKAAALAPLCPYLFGLGAAVHAAAVGIHAICWLLLGLAYYGTRRAFGRLAALLALPGLWTWAEWLGTKVHFLPSHVTTWSQALAVPSLALAPYTGVWGLSTLAAAVVCAPFAWRRTGEYAANQRTAVRLAIVCWAAALLLPPIAGWLLEAPEPPPPAERPLKVAAFALEANDSMERSLEEGEWNPDRRNAIEAYLRERTGTFARLLHGKRPDLVLLPEDAIDFTLPDSISAEAQRQFGIENNGLLIEAYRELARSIRAELAVGLTTLRQGRRYNSTLLIAKTGALLGLRHKWRLTPGSEYWPVPRWLPIWLFFSHDNRYVHPAKAYSAPDEKFPLMRLRDWKLGANTCLEGHMPEMYLGWRRAGAELVLFLGNAHWFHWDPYQSNLHLLHMVRLSAAAYGIPVVMTGKASNAGVVDAKGRHRVWPGILDGGREQPHEVEVARAPSRLTVATRWGEYYLYLSAALALASTALGWALAAGKKP